MFRANPSRGRITSALMIAALAAAAPTVLLGPLAFIVFPIALMVTAAHTLVLAWPAYLILRRRIVLNYGNATMAGFIIGALPMFGFGVFNALTTLQQFAMRQSDWLGQLVGIPLLFGLLGGIGGLAFRKALGSDDEWIDFDPAIFE